MKFMYACAIVLISVLVSVPCQGERGRTYNSTESPAEDSPGSQRVKGDKGDRSEQGR